MNIEYELIIYDRLIEQYPFESKICKRKRSQIRNLKNKLKKILDSKKEVKVIKLNTQEKEIKETELDIFYKNILKHGNCI